ncbi:MAG TPA: ferritin-like domain-containing protein [Hyphomicrobiales bacterium]|nr:ferritin-like domain-containing protein [Hyphomicrobiales bacterium]
MGLFSKDVKSMKDLFRLQLQDIYYAEQQIAKNLPEMAEKASDPALKAAFRKHLDETRTHVDRLEQVFGAIGEEASGTDCEAIDGILKEAKHVVGNIADREVCDAAMLASAQAVEHYEITRYGTLIAWAKELGLSSAVSPLEKTLGEEKATDKALTDIAESRLNRRAAA